MTLRWLVADFSQAWVYRCTLNDRDVFTYLKPLSERESKRLGFDTTLWSFWLLDGGYTTKHFLASAPDQKDLGWSHKKLEIAKRKLGDVDSDDPEQRSTRVTRQRVSAGDGREATTPANTAFRPINALSKATRSLRFTKPVVTDEQQDQHDEEAEITDTAQANAASSGPRERWPSFDSMYDSTPRPEAHIDDSAVAATVEAGGTMRPPQQPASRITPLAARASTPQSTGSHAQKRFRAWFSVDWAPGRNVVRVNESMTVQDFYSIVRQRLQRQLQGKELLALTMRLRQSHRAEESINIEIDDSDGWEALLEMAEEDGTGDIYGTVIVKSRSANRNGVA